MPCRPRTLLQDRAVPLGRDRAGPVLAAVQDDLQRRTVRRCGAGRGTRCRTAPRPIGLWSTISKSSRAISGRPGGTRPLRRRAVAGAVNRGRCCRRAIRFPGRSGAVDDVAGVAGEHVAAQHQPRRRTDRIAASVPAPVRTKTQLTNVACRRPAAPARRPDRDPAAADSEGGPGRQSMARRIGPVISTSSSVAAGAAMRTPMSAGVSESILIPATLHAERSGQ